jgi:predicted NAD-dependent protein-ADP-ribosyltransferase YbiA (DUF1768 family)
MHDSAAHAIPRPPPRDHEAEFPKQSFAPSQAAWFLKTSVGFGGLSNMAAGFGLMLHGIPIRTSEHLYQALKLHDHPEAQRQVLSKASPLQAKWAAKGHVQAGRQRADWEDVKVELMAWCLRVKLAQHPIAFGNLLAKTGVLPIVEVTKKRSADFWGAYCAALEDDPPRGECVGHNVLGTLLMRLRDFHRESSPEEWLAIPAPSMGASLLGRPIGAHRGRLAR